MQPGWVSIKHKLQKQAQHNSLQSKLIPSVPKSIIQTKFVTFLPLTPLDPQLKVHFKHKVSWRKVNSQSTRSKEFFTAQGSTRIASIHQIHPCFPLLHVNHVPHQASHKVSPSHHLPSFKLPVQTIHRLELVAFVEVKITYEFAQGPMSGSLTPFMLFSSSLPLLHSSPLNLLSLDLPLSRYYSNRKHLRS